MIKFENVSKQFSSQFVLQNFSYKIHKGDKINISGRSGIGKTTLFRLLLGFELPDAGSIYFKDKLITEKTVWELRREIAYINQDLTIGSGKVQKLYDETLTLKVNATLKYDAQNNIIQLLDYFELPVSILNKEIEGLSGGEKQRVAIINALLLKRHIFLLDEITSGLDKPLKKKVLDYFFLQPEYTILSISHDGYLPENVEVRTLKLDKL